MTIRRKLVLWLALLFTAVIAVGGTGVVVLLRNQLVGDIDERLQQRQQVSERLTNLPADFLDQAPPVDALPIESDVAFLFFAADGEVLGARPSGPEGDPVCSRPDGGGGRSCLARRADSRPAGVPEARAEGPGARSKRA